MKCHTGRSWNAAGWIALTSLLCVATPTRAFTQSAARLVRVDGLAYDSLMNRPLAAAFISVVGTGRSTTSDGKGRWRIDSVPEGNHEFAMQHAAFDSIGLSGASRRVAVESKMQRLVIALPSFATLWRGACGTADIPRTGVVVYGTLRDANSGAPRADVFVDGFWEEMTGGGKTLASLGQRRWRLTTASDARGEYALCGVAMGPSLRVIARRDTARETPDGAVELLPSLVRVRRLDLLVATQSTVAVDSSTTAGATTVSAPIAVATTAPSRDSARPGSARARATDAVVGVVTGVITNAAGQPLENAVIGVDTFPEVRSGADGRFVVRNVPAGSRPIAVIAVGMQPFTSTVNLLAGDTARLTVPMARVQQLLDAVTVKATVMSVRVRDFEERKRMGFGDMRDSTEIKNYPSLVAVLSTINGVQIRAKNRMNFTIDVQGCGNLDFRLDGHPSTKEDIALLDPQDVAAVEVYRRTIPTGLISYRGCPIIVWTKRGLGK